MVFLPYKERYAIKYPTSIPIRILNRITSDKAPLVNTFSLFFDDFVFFVAIFSSYHTKYIF